VSVARSQARRHSAADSRACPPPGAPAAGGLGWIVVDVIRVGCC
jgi:hypothetical protein